MNIQSSNRMEEKADEVEKIQSDSGPTFLRNINFDFCKLGERMSVSVIPTTKISFDEQFKKFDDHFKFNFGTVKSSENGQSQIFGKFGFIGWIKKSKSTETSTSSISQSLVQRYNSRTIFNNLIQFYSHSCYDFISPGFVMRNRHMMIVTSRPSNWTKLNLIEKVCSGIKLNSIMHHFPHNQRFLDQNIKSVLFSWLMNFAAGEKFTSYPEEYTFDILVVTFMEHQGIISLEEFQVLIWTVVAVNEKLINKNQQFNDNYNNSRAERVVVLYQQMHHEMLEITNGNYGYGDVVLRKFNLLSNSCRDLKSFNKKFFVNQHSVYLTHSSCNQINRSELIENQKNIPNILENKLNLNFFNKMRIGSMKVQNSSLKIVTPECSTSSNDVVTWNSKMKKLKMWLKTKLRFKSLK